MEFKENEKSYLYETGVQSWEGLSHVGICFIDDCFLFKAMGY